MSWTTEKPTMPGWYWHKGPFFEPMIFLLDKDETGAMFLLEGGCWEFDELDGQWAGPLEPPKT